MNEKIKLLARQAQQELQARPQTVISIPMVITQEEFNKKFAELIIQDACAVLLNWKKEPFPFDEDLAVSLIKEHFGVKE